MANHRKFAAQEHDLRQLYLNDGMSLEAIAAKYGVCHVTVLNWIRKYGIPSKPNGGRCPAVPEQALRDMYIRDGLTMREIAEKLGCKESAVAYAVNRYGLRLTRGDLLARRLERNASRYPLQMMHRGYRRLMRREHPAANRDGYVDEHRVVAEGAIGRYLKQGEQVHHLSLDKTDNSVDNLAVLPSLRDHARLHKYMERVGAYYTGFSKTPPEPLGFEKPVFIRGRWVTQIDLIEEFKPNLDPDKKLTNRAGTESVLVN